jgi:phosphatidylglycerophosphate synthase
VKVGILIVDSAVFAAEPAVLGQLLGGIPMLERQRRLLLVSGVERVVLVTQSVLSRAVAGAWPALPPNTDILLAPDGDLAFAVKAAGRGANAVLALRAEDVYERRVFAKALDASRGFTAFSDPRRPGQVGLVGASGAQLAEVADWAASRALPTQASTRALGPGDWVGAVRSAAELLAVQEALWEGCRKPLDGFVSRHFNRHVSLFVSRRIAHTSISPNQISAFNLVLGVAGAIAAAQGTYAAILAGALLLELNSILDGCDGELARMRIQSSVLGEWLDTISDDLSNQGFFGGLAWGMFHATGTPLWAWLGLLTVVPMAATSAYYYYWLYRGGRGDLLAFDWFQKAAAPKADQSAADRFIGVFAMLFRRDAFVTLIAIAALFGAAHWALFVTAPAAVAIALSIVVRRPRPI